MEGYWLKELQRALELNGAHLPEVRCNLFIQYKRSDFLVSRGAKGWDNWEQPFYRYKITPKQHETLTGLTNLANGRAKVFYAAAAFHEMETLFRYSVNGTVVQHSNLAEADKIGLSHKHYSYITSGNNGVAHSEPEKVESQTFEMFLNEVNEKQARSFNSNIKELSNAILEAAYKQAEQRDVFQVLLSHYAPEAFNDYPLIKAYGVISAFTEANEVTLHYL